LIPLNVRCTIASMPAKIYTQCWSRVLRIFDELNVAPGSLCIVGKRDPFRKWLCISTWDISHSVTNISIVVSLPAIICSSDKRKAIIGKLRGWPVGWRKVGNGNDILNCTISSTLTLESEVLSTGSSASGSVYWDGKWSLCWEVAPKCSLKTLSLSTVEFKKSLS